MQEVVVISVRHGLWRGSPQAVDAELERRRADGALAVWAPPIGGWNEAAAFVDQLGQRLLARQAPEYRNS